MKKNIIVLLALSLSLCLFSCGEKEEYISDGYDVNPVQYNDGKPYKVINMPTKILYRSSNDVFYYSKADSKCYLFNSDPLAGDNDDIINDMNNVLGSYVGVWDSDYCNGRYYNVFDNKLYSAAQDATDIRLVFSAGYSREGTSSILRVSHYKQYLYFLLLRETGGHDLYRYDTIKDKTENLCESGEISISYYFFGDDCIYFRLTNDIHFTLCRANLDLTDPAELEGSVFGIYDGEFTYYKNPRTNNKISRCNLSNCETELLYEAGQYDRVNIVCVSDEHLYFTIEEKVTIGTYRENVSVNETGGKLWRMDKNGENLKLVMDDLRYCVTAMTQCGGEFFGKAGIFDLETAKYEGGTAKILFDEDGMFAGAEMLKIG